MAQVAQDLTIWFIHKLDVLLQKPFLKLLT